MGAGEGECSKKLLYQDDEQQRAQGVLCDVFWLDLFAKSFIGASADGIDPQCPIAGMYMRCVYVCGCGCMCGGV